jgi:hypothetical protein
MTHDDNERLDTVAAAAFIAAETGVPTKPKTVANWRNAGAFPPGDWEWFGRAATITKGRLRKFIRERRQAEPSRRPQRPNPRGTNAATRLI